MPSFQYRALTQSGELVSGSISAPTAAEVASRIEYLGLVPIETVTEARERGGARFSFDSFSQPEGRGRHGLHSRSGAAVEGGRAHRRRARSPGRRHRYRAAAPGGGADPRPRDGGRELLGSACASSGAVPADVSRLGAGRRDLGRARSRARRARRASAAAARPCAARSPTRCATRSSCCARRSPCWASSCCSCCRNLPPCWRISTPSSIRSWPRCSRLSKFVRAHIDIIEAVAAVTIFAAWLTAAPRPRVRARIFGGLARLPLLRW